MINKEILIKRLTHIKQLYQIGIGQSYQHENISVFSILTFHDSIEMFLKLLAEHKGIDSSKFNFMNYWEKIPELTLMESMRSFNARRVNIKHRGLLPAKSEIEISRVNTIEFFEQNTIAQFDINFSEISLIDLVVYSKVRDYLIVAQSALNENKVEDSIENSAYAFEELLYSYEQNKSFYGSSPFFFGKSMSFMTSFSLGLSRGDSDLEKISKFVDNVSESIKELQKAVKITSFGIDYREYIKFKLLTPHVTRFMGGNVNAQIMGKRKWTKENCQYCIDFVIKSSLQLQEFDFDIETLQENRFIEPLL